jgi:DnaJ-class molecular chaperone
MKDKTCTKCHGSGEAEPSPFSDSFGADLMCPPCQGTGVDPDKRVTGKMLGDAQNAHQKLVGHYMPHDAIKAVLKAALAAQDTGDTP